uniref:50S ribosomal protein L19 n=1 Tax=Lambia antarctica TaxID=101717 RepID=A0A1L2EDT5_9CHLO|nr:50S ribosomal protein L19 [Lambia antarctica]ANN39041.1 50S ribosomal protein L19 [Lambia antarctica]
MFKTEILRKFAKKENQKIPVGSLIEIGLKIKEGEKSRVQKYKGIVIATKGMGIDQTIRVRKIFQKVGIERVFPLNSPQIDFINCLNFTKMKKSKLYYFRNKIGKSLIKLAVPKKS